MNVNMRGGAGRRRDSAGKNTTGISPSTVEILTQLERNTRNQLLNPSRSGANVNNRVADAYAKMNGVSTSPKPNTTASGTGSSNSGSNMTNQLQSLYQQQIKAQQSTANDLANQLKAQQDQYQAQLRAQQEAQRQAAQNAYNNNMSALQQAYDRRLSGLDSNLATTKDLLNSAYQNSRQNLNNSAQKALQEAYINRMMNERSMAQQLNAQGLNGGAAESTIASMLNNYGNARNNINTSVGDSLRELEQNYNSNLANAQQNYNDALSDIENTNMAYRMQLENDLNNNVLGSYQNLYNAFSNLDTDYTNAMYNLLTKQANDSADLQAALYNAMAKNTGNNSDVSVSGGNKTVDVVSNVKRMFGEGMTPQQILNNLSEYSDEEVAQIFAEAGIL